MRRASWMSFTLNTEAVYNKEVIDGLSICVRLVRHSLEAYTQAVVAFAIFAHSHLPIVKAVVSPIVKVIVAHKVIFLIVPVDFSLQHLIFLSDCCHFVFHGRHFVFHGRQLCLRDLKFIHRGL